MLEWDAFDIDFQSIHSRWYKQVCVLRTKVCIGKKRERVKGLDAPIYLILSLDTTTRITTGKSQPQLGHPSNRAFASKQVLRGHRLQLSKIRTLLGPNSSPNIAYNAHTASIP
jgi:hypothetical protein